MEQIYPLREEVIHQFCGLPVCVVMNDGTRHVGLLSACHGGRVVLNGGRAEAMLAKVQQQDTKKKKGGKGKKEANAGSEKAQTQGYLYDPYFYGGGALALDLALIAFLFLLL